MVIAGSTRVTFWDYPDVITKILLLSITQSLVSCSAMFNTNIFYLSKIVKRIKYYYLSKLTVEQTIIVSHVQDLIDMRDHSNYEHINETELKHLLFELCCN